MMNRYENEEMISLDDSRRISSIDLSFLDDDDDDDKENEEPLMDSGSGSGSAEKFLSIRDITKDQSVLQLINEHSIRVRCRVTNKRLVQIYNGKHVLNMALLDETGEIRGFVGEAGARSFDRALKEGEIYCFSHFLVGCQTPWTKTFTSCSHDFLIEMNDNTRVELCPSSSSSSSFLPRIPRIRFNFMSIPEAKVVRKSTTIDVYGLCESFKELERGDFDEHFGWDPDIPRKSIMLTDRFNKKVRVTLQGDDAVSFNNVGALIAIKGAEVMGGKWNRHLRVRKSGCLEINPVEMEAERLSLWSWNERKRLERNKRHSYRRNVLKKITEKANGPLQISTSTIKTTTAKRPRVENITNTFPAPAPEPQAEGQIERTNNFDMNHEKESKSKALSNQVQPLAESSKRIQYQYQESKPKVHLNFPYNNNHHQHHKNHYNSWQGQRIKIEEGERTRKFGTEMRDEREEKKDLDNLFRLVNVFTQKASSLVFNSGTSYVN